ncbi:MAG: hypothetical protein PHE27_02355, partial [Alphaproteobacteria bacterium]|nr:hypothetical protein [Alphaproteobacteria bacterium]
VKSEIELGPQTLEGILAKIELYRDKDGVIGARQAEGGVARYVSDRDETLEMTGAVGDEFVFVRYRKTKAPGP